MITEDIGTTCIHSWLTFGVVDFSLGPPRGRSGPSRRPSGLSSQLKIRLQDDLQLSIEAHHPAQSEQEIISIEVYRAEYIYDYIILMYIQVAPPAGRTWCGPWTAATPPRIKRDLVDEKNAIL